MSDSEDDQPLASRAVPVARSGSGAQARSSAVPTDDPSRRKAAQKAPIIDESDSEDDKPLGARAKPAPAKAAPRPRSADKQPSKAKPAQAAPKPAKVKDEPVSPSGVKTEPGAAPANKQSSRAQNGGAEEKKKRVIVKKEYDMPGQTKDTPLPVDPALKFYTSLREQKPDSEMAKKWCLTYGLLEREEALEYMDEIKRRKGDTRSPGKAMNGTGGARKRAAPGPPRAPASRPAPSRAPAKQKIKDESESEEDEEDFLPQRKLQKKASGSKAASHQSAAAAKPVRAPPAASADRPAVKSRLPSTQKDKAFADGGLDPISDDSDDDVPLGRRMTKVTQ